jgi:hypothetical protein
MDLQTALSNINWLSVIVATIAAFILGSLWYSPVLFGKVWQKELGLSDEKIKNANMAVIFGTSFVLEFIAALVLEMFLGPDANVVTGIIAGALVGIAWIATAIGTNYLFARKSFRLFLIDSGYFVVFFIVMGGILGAW